MLKCLDVLRGVGFLSVAARMLLAVLCGGIIGLEREVKRRPAGFRTHILICVGATLTTMTSQYLLSQGYHTDIARLGAQVVAGVGFIGAGTIIVTRRQRVKGLTTAAGLWASAIVGLALGAGFYEGGVLVTLLILLAEMLLSRLEYRMLDKSPEMSLYIEYHGHESLEKLLQLFREEDLRVLDMEIARHAAGEKEMSSAIFILRLKRKHSPNKLVARFHNVPGVTVVEEV